MPVREQGVDRGIEAEPRRAVCDAVVLRHHVEVVVGLGLRQAGPRNPAVVAAELVLGIAERDHQHHPLGVGGQRRILFPGPQPVVHPGGTHRVSRHDDLARGRVDRVLDAAGATRRRDGAPTQRPAGVLLAERATEGGLRFTALPGGTLGEQRGRGRSGGRCGKRNREGRQQRGDSGDISSPAMRVHGFLDQSIGGHRAAAFAASSLNRTGLDASVQGVVLSPLAAKYMPECSSLKHRTDLTLCAGNNPLVPGICDYQGHRHSQPPQPYPSGQQIHLAQPLRSCDADWPRLGRARRS